MNVKAAIAKATYLCEAIAAPDFAPRGRQVRLVPFSVARRWSPRLAGGDCGGWTCLLLDVLLAEHLRLPRGRRAFVAILRDDVLPNAAALVNTALHELAHDLTTLSVPAANKPIEALGTLGTLTVASLPATLPDSADEHDAKFFRCAAHVAHRSRLAGWSTTLPDLQPCRPRILQAIGDEPRERETEPINAILATPAPAAFVRLWQRAAA